MIVPVLRVPDRFSGVDDGVSLLLGEFLRLRLDSLGHGCRHIIT
ncbi:hypothetical protein AB0O86_19980 [Streptomyces hirsutus]